MEDQALYKVFTFWNGEGSTPEVRRFGIDRGVVSSFQYLNAKLQDVYTGLKNKTYTITWKDEDGDDVVISTDEELMTMLMSLSGEVIKLYVHCKVDENKDDDCEMDNVPMPENAGSPVNLPHFGVTCDGCTDMIIGFRYKCAVCDDFDLCSRCETASMHPEHCMVRMPAPNLPQSVIKAAIRKSRIFLKSVAKDKCYERKYRRDHHGHHSDGDHHGRHRHHFKAHTFGPEGNMPSNVQQHGNEFPRCERGSKRPRGSWYESFVSYMNEFANLAGDIMIDVEKNVSERKSNQPTETTSGENHQTSQKPQSSSLNAQVPKNPQPDDDNVQVPQNPQSNCETDAAQKPSSSNGNTLASETSQPNSVNRPQKVTLPFVPENLTKEEALNLIHFAANGGFPFRFAKTADQEPARVNEKNKEMGQGDQKTPEVDVVKPQASTSGSNIPHEASPDKADDWTMINNEKDLMDTSAPPDPTDVIGFNLPEEFKKRVTFATGSLYPPLNAATAVMDPQEPAALQTPQGQAQAQAQAKGPASQSQPSAPPRPEPTQQKPQMPAQPQPRVRHPKPHIDAAIQHMLTMGFTNDGGWLTQLLESKDGNIAAVLDLLTPVNPKK